MEEVWNCHGKGCGGAGCGRQSHARVGQSLRDKGQDALPGQGRREEKGKTGISPPLFPTSPCKGIIQGMQDRASQPIPTKSQPITVVEVKKPQESRGIRSPTLGRSFPQGIFDLQQNKINTFFKNTQIKYINVLNPGSIISSAWGNEFHFFFVVFFLSQRDETKPQMKRWNFPA